MDHFLKMMYTGRNLMDELATVQVAFDVAHNRIHVYDMSYVCEAQYDFLKKAYTFSDETLQFSRIMFQKKIISPEIVNFNDWVVKVDWVFYSSKSSILRCFNGHFTAHDWHSTETFFYKLYQNRDT